MGEIADMMLDGTLCERCGEYLGEAVGFPVICAACQRDEREGRQEVTRQLVKGFGMKPSKLPRKEPK